MTGHRIAAIVLAAGASRRLGTAKQLLRDANGESLLVRLVRDAAAAGCAPIVVVLGAHADDVREVLAETSVTCVDNPQWTEGMASSIRVGVDHVVESSCSAVLLLACDQPAVSATHLQSLLTEHQRSGARVVSEYNGARGIPAVWPRADWSDLRALEGDRGAKALLRGDEPAIALALGALDLDTPEDVYLWREADRATD